MLMYNPFRSWAQNLGKIILLIYYLFFINRAGSIRIFYIITKCYKFSKSKLPKFIASAGRKPLQSLIFKKN
jgi:hypothetical protein